MILVSHKAKNASCYTYTCFDSNLLTEGSGEKTRSWVWLFIYESADKLFGVRIGWNLGKKYWCLVILLKAALCSDKILEKILSICTEHLRVVISLTWGKFTSSRSRFFSKTVHILSGRHFSLLYLWRWAQFFTNCFLFVCQFIRKRDLIDSHPITIYFNYNSRPPYDGSNRYTVGQTRETWEGFKK